MCAHLHRERKLKENIQDCGDEIRDSVHISSYFSLFYIPPTFSTLIFFLDLVHNNNNAKWDVSENPKEKFEKKLVPYFRGLAHNWVPYSDKRS
jgi:hypothetical protein